MANVKPCPEGYRTLTPYLTVRGAAKAIEFYKKAFQAQEVSRLPTPDGNGVWHADLRIGDTHLMLADEQPGMGTRSPQALSGTAMSIMMYVDNVDTWHKRAVESGAKSLMTPEDMFWGDRLCRVQDPFGHLWDIATHTRDVTPEEMKRGAAEMAKKMGK